MVVVSTESVKADDRPNVSLKTLFSEEHIDGGRAKFGVVTIPPQARIPLKGTGSHGEDEYSLVVKGSILTGIGDKEYRLTAGDASLIPAGEAHWAYNDGDEECEIVWVLVKR